MICLFDVNEVLIAFNQITQPSISIQNLTPNILISSILWWMAALNECTLMQSHLVQVTSKLKRLARAGYIFHGHKLFD